MGVGFDMVITMRSLPVILLLILTSSLLHAQEFRLSYDASMIPELYHQTNLILQQKVGDSYGNYKGKFNISSKEINIRGNHISYNIADLQKNNGKFFFDVNVNGKYFMLPLNVPILESIRFNLYTDSIKPVINYYVNVEGVFSSGKILPLNEDQVYVLADNGQVNGVEWIKPKVISFDKVIFTAISKFDSSIKTSTTIFLKKFNDPRDAEGYEGN